MADKNMQEQIDQLNHKLDLVLEYVEQQRRKREEVEDLMADLSVIGKDAFHHSAIALDKAGVELDSEALGKLVIKLIKNIGTFNEMIEMLESFNDFMKDVRPIFHQVGLDAIYYFAELEKKGFFDYIKEMGRMLDTFTQHYSVEDMQVLTANMGKIASMIKMITTMKPDDELNDKSWFRIFNDARKSAELRKTVAYGTRVMKALAEAR